MRGDDRAFGEGERCEEVDLSSRDLLLSLSLVGLGGTHDEPAAPGSSGGVSSSAGRRISELMSL